MATRRQRQQRRHFYASFLAMRMCISLYLSDPYHLPPLPKRNSPSITIFVKRKNFRPKKKNTDNFCFPLPQEFLAAKVQEKAKNTYKKKTEKKSG